MSENGVIRSAILLTSVGEEVAGEVFKHLSPAEVKKLGQAMAKLSNVNRGQVADVLKAFRRDAEQQTGIGVGSEQYVRSVLTRALGGNGDSALIDRILQARDNSGIESLKWMDADAVAELIQNEHPQIIATILVHLEPDQAGAILTLFSERLRNDVMLRIATLEGVQPGALRDLNEVLTQLLTGTGADAFKKSSRGGVEAAAEILNYLDDSVEASVNSHIRETDADLARRIQDKMFAFDHLVDLDDRAVQSLLREVHSDTLIVAMKGASEELKDKIFKNMSEPAAEMLRDDLEAKGPVRLSRVEAEQREILHLVQRLAEQGQIVLEGRGARGLVE
jgi:flagellar motor switch protein FliG